MNIYSKISAKQGCRKDRIKIRILFSQSGIRAGFRDCSRGRDLGRRSGRWCRKQFNSPSTCDAADVCGSKIATWACYGRLIFCFWHSGVVSTKMLLFDASVVTGKIKKVSPKVPSERFLGPGPSAGIQSGSISGWSGSRAPLFSRFRDSHRL